MFPTHTSRRRDRTSEYQSTSVPTSNDSSYPPYQPQNGRYQSSSQYGTYHSDSSLRSSHYDTNDHDDSYQQQSGSDIHGDAYTQGRLPAEHNWSPQGGPPMTSGTRNMPPGNGHHSTGPGANISQSRPPAAPYPKWTPPVSQHGYNGYSSDPYSHNTTDEQGDIEDYASEGGENQYDEYGEGYGDDGYGDGYEGQDDAYDDESNSMHQQYHAPTSATTIPPYVPQSRPAPVREGPYPGQPGYKWQPPAVMKAFMQHTSDTMDAAPVHASDMNTSMHSTLSHSSRGSNGYQRPSSSHSAACVQDTSPGPSTYRDTGEHGQHVMDSSRHSLSSRNSDPYNATVYHPSDYHVSAVPYAGQSGRQLAPPAALTSQSSVVSAAAVAEGTERGTWIRPSSYSNGTGNDSSDMLSSATHPKSTPPAALAPNHHPHMSLSADPSEASPQFIEWAALQSVQELTTRVDTDNINPSEGADADGNTLLHRACEVGNISIVHYLRESYPSMNCTRMNSSGMQPLHLACEKGMLHIVKYLINNDTVDPSVCTSDGRSALHVAASSGCSTVVSFLLTVIPQHKLMETDSRGMNALHLACMEGHVNVVKLLAKSPAIDVGQTNGQDSGCLEIAIQHGHIEVLQALLSLPFNLRPDIQRAVGSDGSTCLHVACANRRLDIIHYLVHDKGANTLAKDNAGRTPDRVVKDPIVTFLVTGKSADFNGSTSSQVGPSSQSPRSERRSITASTNMVGPAPWADTSSVATKTAGPSSPAISPSADAADGGKSKFKNKPYVPPTNPSFLPPPPANAAAAPPVKSGAFLPTEKPVVNKLKVKDNWIKQDFDDEVGAVTSDSIASLAINESADTDAAALVTPALTSHRAGSADGVSAKTLSQSAEAIATAASPTTGGLVIKHTKREASSDDTAQLFEWVMDDSKIPQLEETLGITPNIKRDVQLIRDNSSGATLLHVACRSGHLAVAQLLVEGVGADVNAVDNDGRTSLHCAVQASRVLLVRYLVKYCGANLDTLDADGKTALDLCAEIGTVDPNTEEITRIISKSIGKSTAKRTKIVLPKYPPGH